MGTKHHRLARENYQGPVWAAFTLCIENRKPFFTNAGTVQVFVEFLKQIAKKYDFRAIYCFMPDHLHLISIGRTEDSDILRGVEEFKQASGFWLESYYPFVRWEKSFHDRIIRARELGIKVRYVLDNPVRRGLVTQWRDYPYWAPSVRIWKRFLEELGPD